MSVRNTGDGVLTRREPHITYRTNQMKFFNAITASAVISTFFIALNPAEEFSSRCKPDGFGGQVCINGDGQKQQYNDNPARSSNYKKAVEDDQK